MDRMERIRGCLLAGAAGDALGYQVEFISLREILRRYGDHGVRTMAPYISDDTQMTLFTAEGMLMGLKHRMPMPACVYQSYLDWYHTQSPHKPGGAFAKESELLREECLFLREAPGNTCLAALGSGKMGGLEEPINISKGCGGVMRTAPCGMLRLVDTPDPEDAWLCACRHAGGHGAYDPPGRRQDAGGDHAGQRASYAAAVPASADP